MDLSNPKAIAERGEAIYREKYKAAYEAEYLGKFVAIDVKSEHAYMGDSADEALELARKEAPTGLFHLMKIGSPGAFRVSYSSNAKLDWIFR
jgi:hypothetical protein